MSIPKYGYVVHETPDDTYAVWRVNMLGVYVDAHPVATYRQQHAAQHVADGLNQWRGSEVE
jgi:hypothetical protein